MMQNLYTALFNVTPDYLHVNVSCINDAVLWNCSCDKTLLPRTLLDVICSYWYNFVGLCLGKNLNLEYHYLQSADRN